MTVRTWEFSHEDTTVEVRSSTRRTKTMSARWGGEGKLIILAPARVTTTTIKSFAEQIIAKRRVAIPTDTRSGDDLLTQRAEELNRRFLEGRGTFRRISWSSAQTRWGSCTAETGTILISRRLAHVPEYVLDSVIVHELVHTFTTDGHGPEFQAWLRRYPQLQRAEGYLEAYQQFGPAS